jgi:hypothetical protein
MAGYVNTDVTHGGYRFRPNPTRLRASGEHVETVSTFMAQQPFGHLASGGIPGAEHQQLFPFHSWPYLAS